MKISDAHLATVKTIQHDLAILSAQTQIKTGELNLAVATALQAAGAPASYEIDPISGEAAPRGQR